MWCRRRVDIGKSNLVKEMLFDREERHEIVRVDELSVR
jgi:hypothetical protein